MTGEQMAAAEKEGIEKKFKLATSISTTNMVCFDQEGRIKKYAGPEEILREFFELRLEFYNKRKVGKDFSTFFPLCFFFLPLHGAYPRHLRLFAPQEFLVGLLTKEHKMLSNKAKFILEIIEGKLVISNKKRAEVIKLLKSRGYDEAVVKKPQENVAEEDPENQEDEDNTDTKGFNYLLEMPISNLTHEKVSLFRLLLAPVADSP